MKIDFKESKDIPTEQLDELWIKIGWKPRGRDKWKEILSKTTLIYTAWDKDKLIGCGRIIEDGIMCMFYDIGVHPDYQKKGIGTKIMNFLIDQIKNKKYASAGLFAWEENPINVSFYEKLGFKKTSGMELTKFMIPE